MLLRVISIAALLTLGACERAEIGAAHYGHEQCRRVALIDSITGNTLNGAEDIALDKQSGRLFFSVYDRRAVEKASRRKAKDLPQGGVYTASAAALFSPEIDSIRVIPLIAPSDIVGGLRPHGLSFDAGNNELVFINRGYQRINDKWELTPRLQRIGANGEVYIGANDDAPCTANDVLVTEQQTFTTFDHGACNWRSVFEDVFMLKRSGLVSTQSGRVFDKAAFANGLTRTLGGEIVMAATREKALVLLNERSGAVEESARIDTPGGPDNLSLSFDGGVVAAAHPSLWRLALNRKIGFGKAPSRVIKADPDTGAIEILFDDRKGKLFSAATIGIEMAQGLIIGSVTDKGVLVCREAP